VASETLFSLLRFGAEELERGDLCSACFEARDPAEDLFFWRTSHREQRGAVKVDFEVVLAVLHKLRQDPRPERQDFCFLLALLLVRHRKLRLQTVLRRGGRELLQLRKPRTTQAFEVAVRELDDERRGRLSGVLAGLLDPTQDLGVDALLDAAPETPAEGPDGGGAEGQDGAAADPAAGAAEDASGR